MSTASTTAADDDAPLATVHPLFRRERPSDAELVAQLREGKSSAHAAFFDRYASVVERTITRIVGVDADVADLVNDAFLRAMQRIDRVIDADALRPWLVRIAVFTAREHVRARRRRRWLSFFGDDSTAPEPVAATASPEVRDAVRRLYRALDALPVDDRVPFTLRHLEGLELTEVASACETSLTTVKRRIARAEKRFVAIARNDPLLASWLEKGGAWTTR